MIFRVRTVLTISFQQRSARTFKSTADLERNLGRNIIPIPYAGQRRLTHNVADSPDFTSVVDNPPQLVKSGRKHGPGLIVLGTVPL